MRISPLPSSRAGRAARVGALVAVAGLTLGACSSSSDDASSSTTDGVGTTVLPTTEPATTTAPESTTTSTTLGGLPPAPSTIPAGIDTTCAALAETYGLAELRPTDPDHWPDERSRISVDARREADLLVTASSTAPPAVAPALGTERDYAIFVATTVEGAAGYSAAVAAIDAYPAAGELSAAVSTVDNWRSANC